eukprot:1347671-Karenia_brevis.AAC.1
MALIPVCVPLSAQNLQVIRSLLRSKVPEWESVPITLSAKYLGFMVGPAVTVISWIEPLENWYRSAM